MDIYLAKTQGFCAGVSFAIEIVERSLAKYGSPLYVYHEIVHNTYVVEDFKNKGVIFIEDLTEAPLGARIIFSAHGVPPKVLQTAEERQLQYVDATCPLVTKVHNEAIKFSEKEYQTILIGHRGHQELIGTAGYVDPDYLHIVETKEDIERLNIDPEADVAFITQTTLSVDDTQSMIEQLKKKFPHLRQPPRSDLCYATQNRQNALKELANICDIIIICGSPSSSNSNRLRETGEKAGAESYIIDKAEEFDLNLIQNKTKIGVSSGASVPWVIVDQLVKRIQNAFADVKIHSFDNPEKNIAFALPEI